MYRPPEASFREFVVFLHDEVEVYPTITEPSKISGW